MRQLAILVAALLILPSAMAVGILVPEDFDDRVTFWDEADRDITFKLKGDSEEQRIRFFIRPEFPILTMNGNGGDYTEELILQPYEVREIPIIFRGTEEKNRFGVTYGFTYVGETNDTGAMGFEQTVASKFDAKVRTSSDNGLDVTVQTNSPGGTRGVGSGGGGGGGRYTGSTGSTENTTLTPEEPPASDNQQEVQLADVTGSRTALTQTAVNTNSPPPDSAFAADGNEKFTLANPKTSGSIFLASLFALMLLMGVTYKVAKEDDDL